MTKNDKYVQRPAERTAAEPPKAGFNHQFPGLVVGPEQITIVSAPYGFGKSSLIEEWFRRERSASRQPRWFCARTVSERRNVDLNTLLDTALGSFVRHDDVAVGADPGEPAAFDKAGLQSPSDDLLDRCSHVRPADRLVFFDHAELLPVPIVDEIIRFANALGGAPWRLIFASRTAINPPLSDGKILTMRRVGPADLRLTPGVVEVILLEAQPLLGNEALSQIIPRLDGWPTAVQLAAKVLADEPNYDTIAREFCGRDIELSDLFETEVFAGLAESDQELLVQSSVLFELDAEGCEFVTGAVSASNRLATLAQSNALLYTKEDGRGYQWMPMARQFLLAKLEQRNVSEVAAARRKAGEWLSRNGHNDDAVGQALMTNDWDSLVEIVLTTGLETIAVGDPQKVTSWLTRLPSSVLQAEGGLAVLGATALWASSGFQSNSTVDDWLDVAEANNDSQPPAGATSTYAAVLTARALMGSAGANARFGFARRALKNEAFADCTWGALAQLALGLSAFFDDQPVIARKALSDCLRARLSTQDTVGAALTSGATSLLALLECETGNPDQGSLLVTMAEIHEETGGFSPGALDLARADQARRAGEPDVAFELMAKVGTSAKYMSMRVLALLNEATLHAEVDDPEAAAASLDLADTLISGIAAPDRLLLRRRREAEERRAAADRVDDEAALTDRELEVLRLLDTDLSRREIANELFLAHNTVKTYVQRLYQKLDVSSRPAAVARARQRGWLV